MNPESTVAKTYTAFPALLLVLVTLLFLQAAYLIDDFKQKSRIQATRQQLQPALTQAQSLNQTTEAVGRELVALAPDSPEASKIIGEFKIQIQSAAPSKNGK